MIRLVAPIGHSRLNLLAALQRVNPDNLLLISSSQTRNIDANVVRSISGNQNLKIEQLILDDAFDLVGLTEKMRTFHSNEKEDYDNLVLISGSTNSIAMMTYLLWGPRTVSLPPPGLQTELDGVIQEHEVTLEDVHSLLGLRVEEDKVLLDDIECFPGSDKCVVSFEEGRINIYWTTPDLDQGYSIRDIKQFLYKVVGLGTSMSAQFGYKTFHHFVTGPEEYEERMPPRGPYTYICEGEDLQ
jgi:hypothetical protein